MKLHGVVHMPLVLSIALSSATFLRAEEKPKAAAAKPEEAKSVPLSPALKQQVRALFEPLREFEKRLREADAAVAEAIEGDDVDKMDRTRLALDRASAAMEAKKAEVMPKVRAAGVNDDQLQAEWTLWLQEVKKEAEKPKTEEEEKTEEGEKK
jgi:hypothetical protein